MQATSALDTLTENSIQEALLALGQDRTVLIIAHRLSTIRHAQQIVVLDAGRVAEIGTHDELIKLPDGLYSKMWAMQVHGASGGSSRASADSLTRWDLVTEGLEDESSVLVSSDRSAPGISPAWSSGNDSVHKPAATPAAGATKVEKVIADSAPVAVESAAATTPVRSSGGNGGSSSTPATSGKGGSRGLAKQLQDVRNNK